VDLGDERQREAWRQHLGALLRGRRVVCGVAPLAGFTDWVRLLHDVGACRPLLVASAVGAGTVPSPEEAERVFVDVPQRATMTEDLRMQDSLVRRLAPDIRSAVDAYDPEHEAVWLVGPFIGTDPIDGRQVLTGRPAGWLALEDKLVADEIWDAVGASRAPALPTPVETQALRSASAALDRGQGVVWAGDARDGFNGGGDFVRWVVTDEDLATATAFFASRCDRVRVMPFLEGVPCSIHGVVMPTGTAVFRPVELSILRSPGRRFVYGGLGTIWEPPPGDRAWMRELARRTGEHLRERVGYRGAFGIDGVLTADGFLPTELNTRMSGGIASLAREVDATLFNLLQFNLLAARDPGAPAAAVEAWALPRMDERRFAKPVAMSSRTLTKEPLELPVTWDGAALSGSSHETGWSVSVGASSVGTYARLNTPSDGLDGTRVASLNVALMRFLDDELGADFGEVSAAPDVRR
jgi:hypothetical protein